jgi:hypothetical protein
MSVEINRLVQENLGCHEEWGKVKLLDEKFMKSSRREDFILPTSK